MAHRSKLSQIVIDCADLDAGLAFWGGALGRPIAGIEEPYGTLGDDAHATGGLRVVVQRVPEPKTAKARVHLDIETDDVEAEVRRLEALGAQRAEDHGTWWVLCDPCGNEFCVFGPELSADFPAGARTWG
jgi:predicted enzyme related to lactoylglutathione lyase